MKEETFAALQEAAQEAGVPELAERIRALHERYASGTYCIAFIGQFSAGKSYLLNNLLGRKNFLPQGRRETTPLLTFICSVKPGEEENAKLYYKGGECRKLPVDEIRNITQHEKDAEWRLDQAVMLQVFLDAPLLKNGLVLLDTPGVNTRIERHELLLAESLKRAANIVYVSNGVPSKVDAEKLLFLQDAGFPLSYVCTHCDEIRASEESESAIQEDTDRTFRNLDIHLSREGMFFLSNLPDSHWYANIEQLKQFLRAKGDDVKSSLEEDTARQAAAYGRILMPKLEELKKLLSAQEKKDTAILEARQMNLEASLENLQNSVEHHQDQLQKDIERAKGDLKHAMQQEVESSVEKLKRELATSPVSIHPNEMQEKLQNAWKQALQGLQRHVNSSMDPVLAELNGTLVADTDASVMTLDEMPVAEHYSEVVKTQDAVLDELQAELERVRKKKEAAEAETSNPEELADLQSELDIKEKEYKDACNACDQQKPYEPRRIELSPASHTGATIGKGVGKAIDFALLFLPTPAGKAGAAKIAAKAAKTGKQVITAGQALGKIKDMAYKTGNVGLLDYLSVEYWGEKLGSKFDDPPKYGYDQTYEIEYRTERTRLLDKKRRVEQEKLRLLQAKNLIRSKAELRKAELEGLDRAEQAAEREIHQREAQIRQRAERAAQKKWHQECVTYYRSGLEAAVRSIEAQYLSGIPNRMQQYQVQRFQMMHDRIAQRKQDLEKLQASSPEEIRNRIQRVAELLEMLNTLEKAAG